MTTLDTDNAIGRSKLTPALISRFVDAIKAGNYYTTACKVLGIEYATFTRWMRVGKNETDEDSLYRQLYLNVKAADAWSEANAVEAWTKHFPRNYKASRDFLARRYHQRWGPKHQITLAVESEVRQIMETLRQRLPEDTYQLVLDVLSETLDSTEDRDDKFIETDEDLDFDVLIGS